jgi:integrase
MGRGRKGLGVERRATSIRVSFTYKGEVCREPLALAPTPPNFKYAARLVGEIKEKIERGTFKYEEYFPDSKRAPKLPTSTIRDRGELWLATKGRLSPATRNQYANTLKFWYEKLGADTLVDAVVPSALEALVGSHPWPGAKLCNNYLISLRGLFHLALRDGLIKTDPCANIENMDVQAPTPDPLTPDEMNAVLEDLKSHYDDQVYNYFDVAFACGLRPEEEIALMWRDID